MVVEESISWMRNSSQLVRCYGDVHRPFYILLQLHPASGSVTTFACTMSWQPLTGGPTHVRPVELTGLGQRNGTVWGIFSRPACGKVLFLRCRLGLIALRRKSLTCVMALSPKPVLAGRPRSSTFLQHVFLPGLRDLLHVDSTLF
jgi:hypothetical protein